MLLVAPSAPQATGVLQGKNCLQAYPQQLVVQSIVLSCLCYSCFCERRLFCCVHLGCGTPVILVFSSLCEFIPQCPAMFAFHLVMIGPVSLFSKVHDI